MDYGVYDKFPKEVNFCQSEWSSDAKKISPLKILKQVQNDINGNLSYILGKKSDHNKRDSVTSTE